MPSPFPGMDPYLEAGGEWEDFHDRFLTHLSEAMLDAIPSHYLVKIQERVTSISLPSREERRLIPDVSVSTPPGVRPTGAVATLPSPTTEPAIFDLDYDEPATETYLEIRRHPDRRLVTVIELLSPSNKEMPGREVYLTKRNTLLNQYVHLVEIDLLLAGTRLGLKGRSLPAGDFFAFVARAERRPKVEVYAWSVRKRMPRIAVPLLEPDPDFVFDLGVQFQLTYDRARYERSIDYTADPPSALSSEDRDWAREVIRQAQPQPAT